MHFVTSAEIRFGGDACGGGGGDGDGGSSCGVWQFCGRRRKIVTHWKRHKEMTQGGDYKYFLKNNLSKADLIRQFNEFMKQRHHVPTLGLPAGDTTGESSMGDIVNWNSEFISM